MKISGIDFPPALMTALRDGRLVVFAGAGVSMGEPARLPDFRKLATEVARGTGEKPEDGETEDRFLGRLRQNGVKVHDLAARSLKGNGRTPAPTDLHRNLLRLYPDPGSVRIITTNFDLLFERAAETVFESPPATYTAPALPFGREFDGIIHVHGSLDRIRGMVLTDEDFGRAYLVHGWTRRFLVEMFDAFTVLFVGYGHNDTIMNYLARALPGGGGTARFALVPEREDAPRWRHHGIEPVAYPPDDDHTALRDGVGRLADYSRRGALDWQREISELAAMEPRDLGEEDADLLDDALSDLGNVASFTNLAMSPDWIGWLAERKHLDSLFDAGRWEEREEILANWLAERFVHGYSYQLLVLVAPRSERLHPDFWRVLGRVAGSAEKVLEPELLRRWVTLLLATVPGDPDSWVLGQLAERCAEAELFDHMIDIINALAAPRLRIDSGHFYPKLDTAGFAARAEPTDRYRAINELWQKSPKPNLERIAEGVLTGIVGQLSVRHRILQSWGPEDRPWSPVYHRAVESREKSPAGIDGLVDVARDCLEWLEKNRPESATRWRDLLAASGVFLLRRLAAHALSACFVLDSDRKIDWLLARMDLHDEAASHEICRVVEMTYPDADQNRRQAVIQAVWACRPPGEGAGGERHAADLRYAWFNRLLEASSSCDLANEALRKLLEQYPELSSRRKTGTGSIPVPTAAKLLAKPAPEWVEELSSFYPATGASQGWRAESVEQAVRQNSDWGLDLADALTRCENWNSVLWKALLDAWRGAKPDNGKCWEILAHLRQPELQQGHAVSIARFLQDLARDDRIPDTSLNVAQGIADALWRDFDRGSPVAIIHGDWLTTAINCTPGLVAEFWLQALSCWRKRQDPVPAALGGVYEKALSGVVEDRSGAGRLGRVVLASQLAFLLAVDEDWTRERLLPAFIDNHHPEDRDAVWNGFLARLRFNPRLAELTEGAFLDAVERVENGFPTRRRNFIRGYVIQLAYFADDPPENWILKFFSHAGKGARSGFATCVGLELRNMNEARQEEWWDRWLGEYWRARLDGKPKRLDDGEIRCMLEWLPDLASVFPKAVDLAIEMPPVELKRSMIVYEIDRSDLWKRYPDAVARLLLYLRQSGSPGYVWHGGKELVAKLLEMKIPAHRADELRELDAAAGW